MKTLLFFAMLATLPTVAMAGDAASGAVEYVTTPSGDYSGSADGGVILAEPEHYSTPISFRPPVEINIVAKTDSRDLRFSYAADQVILNWARDSAQLRIDGGPANGLHKEGAGEIPADKYVTIRWTVLPTGQRIYVGKDLRFMHMGDYSQISKPVSVFSGEGSYVTLKSLTVRQLPSNTTFDPLTAPQNPAVAPVDYVKMLASDFTSGTDGGIALQAGERLTTPTFFKPPVDITFVAKTDSTDLRFAYAADQVILRWKVNHGQLRISGGPADGKHRVGAGDIPPGKYVTVRWLVLPTKQCLYVDGNLRFEDHDGAYSKINNAVSIFAGEHSHVTVKSLLVHQLPPGTMSVSTSEAGGHSTAANVPVSP